MSAAGGEMRFPAWPWPWWGIVFSQSVAETADALPPESADELAEIRRAAAGDEQAYRRVVERYQQEVGRHLWRFTQERGTLEELVQTTFVEAYFSLPKFRGTGSFRGWLLQIATRVGYALWRQRTRDRKRNTQALEAEPASEERTESNGLLELLQQLPPRDRLALTLMYVEGYSLAEAASLAGWSQTMTKVQAFRARRKLRALWEKTNGS